MTHFTISWTTILAGVERNLLQEDDENNFRSAGTLVFDATGEESKCCQVLQ
jgi:hypothetical protein